MKIYGPIAGGLLLALCPGLFLAAQTTAFTVVATSVTMPASGNGSTAYTVSNIPMTGQLGITCKYSGPTTTAKIPTCGGGPAFSDPVNVGQTVKGVITLYPYGVGIPAAGSAGLQSDRNAGLFALALAVPLLGLGWRRGRRWLVPMAIGVVVLGGVSACGGSPNAMTSGTYQYTVSAANESSGPTPLGAAVNTTFNVTVQ